MINDNQGHQKGDQLLVCGAEVIKTATELYQQADARMYENKKQIKVKKIQQFYLAC